MKLDSLGKIIRLVAILFMIAFSVVYYLISQNEALPVYQPSDINPKLVDPKLQGQKENHHILDFELVNQDSVTVTLQQLKGKIMVVSAQE